MFEQMFTKQKPEVHYIGNLTIREWWGRQKDTDPIVYVAMLDVVIDHPRLGKCYDVRTSVITEWPDDKGNFETMNIRYIRTYPTAYSVKELIDESEEDN